MVRVPANLMESSHEHVGVRGSMRRARMSTASFRHSSGRGSAASAVSRASHSRSALDKEAGHSPGGRALQRPTQLSARAGALREMAGSPYGSGRRMAVGLEGMAQVTRAPRLRRHSALALHNWQPPVMQAAGTSLRGGECRAASAAARGAEQLLQVDAAAGPLESAASRGPHPPMTPAPSELVSAGVSTTCVSTTSSAGPVSPAAVLGVRSGSSQEAARGPATAEQEARGAALSSDTASGELVPAGSSASSAKLSLAEPLASLPTTAAEESEGAGPSAAAAALTRARDGGAAGAQRALAALSRGRGRAAGAARMASATAPPLAAAPAPEAPPLVACSLAQARQASAELVACSLASTGGSGGDRDSLTLAHHVSSGALSGVGEQPDEPAPPRGGLPAAAAAHRIGYAAAALAAARGVVVAGEEHVVGELVLLTPHAAPLPPPPGSGQRLRFRRSDGVDAAEGAAGSRGSGSGLGSHARGSAGSILGTSLQRGAHTSAGGESSVGLPSLAMGLADGAHLPALSPRLLLVGGSSGGRDGGSAELAGSPARPFQGFRAGGLDLADGSTVTLGARGALSPILEGHPAEAGAPGPLALRPSAASALLAFALAGSGAAPSPAHTAAAGGGGGGGGGGGLPVRVSSELPRASGGSGGGSSSSAWQLAPRDPSSTLGSSGVRAPAMPQPPRLQLSQKQQQLLPPRAMSTDQRSSVGSDAVQSLRGLGSEGVPGSGGVRVSGSGVVLSAARRRALQTGLLASAAHGSRAGSEAAWRGSDLCSSGSGARGGSSGHFSRRSLGTPAARSGHSVMRGELERAAEQLGNGLRRQPSLLAIRVALPLVGDEEHEWLSELYGPRTGETEDVSAERAVAAGGAGARGSVAGSVGGRAGPRGRLAYHELTARVVGGEDGQSLLVVTQCDITEQVKRPAAHLGCRR